MLASGRLPLSTHQRHPYMAMKTIETKPPKLLSVVTHLYISLILILSRLGSFSFGKSRLEAADQVFERQS